MNKCDSCKYFGERVTDQAFTCNFPEAVNIGDPICFAWSEYKPITVQPIVGDGLPGFGD